MDYDADIKRAQFIEKSLEIREIFSFAHPLQILQAVNTYAAHFYGSMLWNLYGHSANRVFRSWNSCVKLSWKLPRWCHNYFVENLLSPNIPHVRKRILCQYLGFFKKLINSKSSEVQFLAKMVACDRGSITAQNLCNIGHEFNLDPWVTTPAQLARTYKQYIVPEGDGWRLLLLEKLLEQRRVQYICDEEVNDLEDLIQSLCSS